MEWKLLNKSNLLIWVQAYNIGKMEMKVAEQVGHTIHN